MRRAYSARLVPELTDSQQCYYVSVSKFSGRKSARQPVFNALLDWSITHLYLSLANVLAASIVLATTINAIETCIHVNRLELGVFAVPFIACLDILFIALVASLFVRRLSGFIMYLGFVAILIVPKVAFIVVIDVLHRLSGINNIPDGATSRLIESSIVLVLSLIYLWDIISRTRIAKQGKATFDC